MKKIKVVHIITKLELGGAQGNTLYTVEHLNKDLFDVYLLTGNGGILDSKAEQLAKDGIIKLFYIKNLVREIRPWKDFFALIELIKLLNKIKPDIVHTHSSKAGILGRWASFFNFRFQISDFRFKNQKSKIKNQKSFFYHLPFIIHTFHGFGFSDFHSWFIKNFYIFLEFWTAKISDKLIFVSNANIETARKYNIIPKTEITETRSSGFSADAESRHFVGMKQSATSTRAILIRSGIKINDYKNLEGLENLKVRMLKELNISTGSKIVTTIGPFKPQKNLVDFINVAKIIISNPESETHHRRDFSPNEHCDFKGGYVKGSATNHYSPLTNCQFLIIGDGEQRNSLEFRVESLGLRDKVKFLGWRKDIPEILSFTDIFVMTSLWEGLPRSAVESLVSGVPVVAYEIDGLKDIVKNGFNGYLVEPRNIQKLANKVIDLLTDEKKLTELKTNARSSIDKSFDIDYMVSQQEELYEMLTKTINLCITQFS